MMMKHMVKTCWLIILACFILSYGFLLTIFIPSGVLLFISIVSFFLGIMAWLYIFIRIVIFQKKMMEFINHLLKGNYEVGVKSNKLFIDEIHQLEEGINKVGAQLKAYDSLRAEKVDLSRRVLSLILKNVSQGVIMAHMEKKTFQLNPVIQSLFQVEQEELTFEAIEKQEGNSEFMTLFDDAAIKDKVPKEGMCSLQLPAHGLTRKISFKIVPLKDKQENVSLATIFIHEAPENSGK